MQDFESILNPYNILEAFPKLWCVKCLRIDFFKNAIVQSFQFLQRFVSDKKKKNISTLLQTYAIYMRLLNSIRNFEFAELCFQTFQWLFQIIKH